MKLIVLQNKEKLELQKQQRLSDLEKVKEKRQTKKKEQLEEVEDKKYLQELEKSKKKERIIRNQSSLLLEQEHR